MNKFKDVLTGDKLCFGSLLAAATMLFTFAFIENPTKYTISTIGATEHPYMFIILCALMSFATLINMLRFFKSVGYTYKIVTVLTYIMNAAMLVTSVTTTLSDNPVETAVHWTTAMMFIAVNPLIILSCGIYRIIRGNIKILIPVIFFHSIYAADIVVMLVSFAKSGANEGKNGIMEIIPLGITFIILLLANNTKLFCKKGEEVKREKMSSVK